MFASQKACKMPNRLIYEVSCWLLTSVAKSTISIFSKTAQIFPKLKDEIKHKESRSRMKHGSLMGGVNHGDPTRHLATIKQLKLQT